MNCLYTHKARLNAPKDRIGGNKLIISTTESESNPELSKNEAGTDRNWYDFSKPDVLKIGYQFCSKNCTFQKFCHIAQKYGDFYPINRCVFYHKIQQKGFDKSWREVYD